MSIELHNGDCLEVMATIESGSVDAIICDPPYGTVKNAPSTWDAAKTAWDDTINHAAMLEQCNRILRPNGALVLFSQDPYTAKLMTDTHGNLPFSYRYTWLKDNYGHALLAKKAPLNYTEDVCVFFKRHTKHDFGGFHPCRPYAAEVCKHIGMSKKDVFALMGHQGMCHFMRHDSTQFNLCTEKTYTQLAAEFSLRSLPWFVEYSELKQEDAAYRAALIERMTAEFPKTFNLPPDAKYKSNVLEYRKDYRGEHPTQKPVALMEDLVSTYTNEGDTVLDFTMGSGTTGVACKNLSRDFIGIEMDEGYFEIAKKRIEEASSTLFTQESRNE